MSASTETRNKFAHLRFSGRENDFSLYKSTLISEINEYDSKREIECANKKRHLKQSAAQLLIQEVEEPARSSDPENNWDYLDHKAAKMYLRNIFNHTLPTSYKNGLLKDISEMSPFNIMQLLEDRFGSSTPISITNDIERIFDPSRFNNGNIISIIDSIKSDVNKINKQYGVLSKQKKELLVTEALTCPKR